MKHTINSLLSQRMRSLLYLHLVRYAIFFSPAVSGDSQRSFYPNVALLKPTSQGPRDYNSRSISSLAVDGIPPRDNSDCTHTKADPINWWLVDLENTYIIHQVAILNRFTFSWRTKNFTIDIFDVDPREMLPEFPEGFGKVCAYEKGSIPAAEWTLFDCGSPVVGRFVRMVKYGYGVFHICEFEVYASNLTSYRVFRQELHEVDGSKNNGSVSIGNFRNKHYCAFSLIYQLQLEAFTFDPATGNCVGLTSNISTW